MNFSLSLIIADKLKDFQHTEYRPQQKRKLSPQREKWKFKCRVQQSHPVQRRELTRKTSLARAGEL